MVVESRLISIGPDCHGPAGENQSNAGSVGLEISPIGKNVQEIDGRKWWEKRV